MADYKQLSPEDRTLLRAIGTSLRLIVQGKDHQSISSDRRDELGVLANMVNRVARELELSRERDQAQREEIGRRVAELELANERQEHLIATIREISTPTLNVAEGVLLLPIIGALDSARALQMLSSLMEAASSMRARVVILDITGVTAVDTHIANVLIQAARTVRLLGGRTILCGIAPEVAQVIVSLGIDLSELATTSDLRSALAMSLKMTNTPFI
ncbi:STAS domain-containing protein [Chloroflexia bacterium SDU3-3]|nr:STAS domain-containing protein [Chloroflexia bacterium SDU3-3]